MRRLIAAVAVLIALTAAGVALAPDFHRPAVPDECADHGGCLWVSHDWIQGQVTTTYARGVEDGAKSAQLACPALTAYYPP